MVLLEGRLVIYSTRGWAVFDMAGTKLEEVRHPGPNCILKLQMLSMEQYSVIEWSGMEEDDTSGDIELMMTMRSYDHDARF